MAELYYRLHWAAIELRLQGKKSDKIDEGIVRERHRALNWLIGYMEQKWDDSPWSILKTCMGDKRSLIDTAD